MPYWLSMLILAPIFVGSFAALMYFFRCYIDKF